MFNWGGISLKKMQKDFDKLYGEYIEIDAEARENLQAINAIFSDFRDILVEIRDKSDGEFDSIYDSIMSGFNKAPTHTVFSNQLSAIEEALRRGIKLTEEFLEKQEQEKKKQKR